MNKLSGMNSIGGKIVLWGLILTMLVFTAVRTLHFLMLTFPPDQQYVAFLALAAFDVGVLGWFYYATHSAEGAAQRTIAYGMIFICLAGVAITTIADMILVGAQNGLTKLPPQWGTIGLWGVIIVIILNVASGILVHLTDPKHLQHMAKESAKDKIHSLVVSEIHARAEQIAPMVAQQAAQYWVNQTVHDFIGHIPGAKNPAQLPAPTANPTEVTGELIAMPQTASTPVPLSPVLPAIDNPQKMLDLLDKAVKYGQITEEEASPLRQALKASAPSQGKNGAH